MQLEPLADNGANKVGEGHLIVNGEGCDLNNKKALQGRAKRKTSTLAIKTFRTT